MRARETRDRGAVLRRLVEVDRLVARGARVELIADHVGCCERTARRYVELLRRVFGLNVVTRYGVIRYATPGHRVFSEFV